VVMDAAIPGPWSPGAGLSCAQLSGTDLAGIHLTANSDLSGIDLAGANLGLSPADVDGGLIPTVLADVDLTDAVLIGTDLTYAELSGASLRDGPDADVLGAMIEGTIFEYANLPGTDLVQTVSSEEAMWAFARYDDDTLWPHDQFYWRSFGMLGPESTLTGVDLSDMPIQDVDLTRANLKAAVLNRTYAQRAIFDDANLEQADLGGSILNNASFVGANLKKANFVGATLTGADFKDSYCTEDTMFGDKATRAFQVVIIPEDWSLTNPPHGIDILPGWNVDGRACCFPSGAGILHLGCPL